MAPVLELAGLTRRFGGVTAVDGLALSVNEGELVSVIGPNGAGKTTMFNLVTGLDKPDAGTVTFAGRDVTGLPAERLAALDFARTFQHGRVFGNLSVLDNVLVGAHTRLKAVAAAMAGSRTNRRACACAGAARLREGRGSSVARAGARHHRAVR